MTEEQEIEKETETLFAVVKLNATDCLSWSLQEIENRLLLLALGPEFQKYDIGQFEYAIVGAMHQLEPDQVNKAGVMYVHLLFEVRGEIGIKEEFRDKKKPNSWKEKFKKYFPK